MKLLITLQLEEGDTHPATVRIAGSSGIVLNSVSAGHVSVSPELVSIGTIEQDQDEPDEQAE